MEEVSEAEVANFEYRFVRAGKISSIPSKQAFKKAMGAWLIRRFEGGRIYTEPEVNEILLRVHDDYAYLRRDLVDRGLLSRSDDGTSYWRTEREGNAHL